jgi:DNA-binding transcriptional regulator LsrR (DeoR family)
MGQKKQTHNREIAKILFMQGFLQQEISEKIGVSKVSVCRWSKEEHWETLKKNLVNSKTERLSELYDELAALNLTIKSRESGQRFPLPKEADIRRKIIKDISDLETKYNVAEASVIARDFTLFCRDMTQGNDKELVFAKEVNNLFELFIDHLIEKQKWQGVK